jgi:glycosyltransferase involved in cell wall biosynthesis
MTGTAPVSVVIPCFRCGGSIARAIASVRAQSLPPAQLIVVDDASDDGSPQAVAALGAGVRSIRLASNQGPAAARNAGWAAATQPYLAFLDADDAWHPRKVELQLGWMQANPAATLTGHVITDGAPQEVSAALAAERVSPAMLLRSNRFQTSSVMLRRDIAQRFADGKRYCEDYLLWLEIVLAGAPAFHLDAPLAMRFKPVYGAGGASGRLWDMERGELDALARVRRSGLLGLPGYAAAAAWSSLKFLRRLATAPRAG